ncbi:MAG: hypothetical protein JSV92_01420 [archaeon]|nr:MAG: hypothetical protein JSV92_01420 [archaeon]
MSKKFKDHHYDIFESYLKQKRKIHEKKEEIGKLEEEIEKLRKVNEELRKRLEIYETVSPEIKI